MTNISIDLILANGKIWTGNPAQPEVEALAIGGSTVAAAGDSAGILGLRNSKTQVIDLRGRRAVPGFNDAHVHFYLGGKYLASVDLRDAKNEAEFRDRIERFAQSRPDGEWILGGSWDPEGWASGRLPSCQLIDGVTPRHPVFVTRLDGHTALANSVAMKLAGIDCNTPDVPGGVIQRDATGNPTGIFQDAAKPLIEALIPTQSQQHITDAIVAAQRHAASLGVTSVHDMGMIGTYEIWPEVIRAYSCLEQHGRLKTRVSAHHPLPQWQKVIQMRQLRGLGNETFRIGPLKGFSDGSLGSSTAWFFDAYTDSPHNCGLASDEMLDPETMYGNIRGADAAGLGIAIHAIGDRANRAVLDFYERMIGENGGCDRRVRIEHVQHLQASDIPRFAKLGVIASGQPYHCIDDARWAERRIGSARAQTTYAFRSLLDTGAVLAFGSDWFVEPMSPILGIYAAATRRSTDGKHVDGWVPAQKITVAEAVKAYTMGSAYASREENIKGTLEPGRLADVAVLSEDIFTIDPTAIRHTQVDLTIFDGQVIYERG